VGLNVSPDDMEKTVDPTGTQTPLRWEGGTRQRSALRHYATSRKVAGSRSDEVNELFSMYLILPATLGPGVHSASNRNEYQKQKNVSGE
jgi:hypothetical protein